MNERINELFGQALDAAVPETWTTLNPIQLARLRDKFAELIVKECMQVCSEQRNPYTLNYKPSEKFAAAIGAHFDITTECGCVRGTKECKFHSGVKNER